MPACRVWSCDGLYFFLSDGVFRMLLAVMEETPLGDQLRMWQCCKRGWRIEATPGVACFIAEFVVCGAVMSQDKIC